jgi:glucan phosphoethanolaminetransferase (alkaline phosphatase superfamily)
MNTSKNYTDKIGMFLSGLCVIHCLLTPIAIVLIGTGWLLSIAASPWFHIVLFLPVLLLVITSIAPTAWRSKSFAALSSALVGLIMMASAMFMHNHGHPGHAQEPYLSILGALLVFFGHWLNFRQCKHGEMCPSQHK